MVGLQCVIAASITSGVHVEVLYAPHPDRAVVLIKARRCLCVMDEHLGHGVMQVGHALRGPGTPFAPTDNRQPRTTGTVSWEEKTPAGG